MDEDELYAYGYKPVALSCSEIKPCSPCKASSSTEGSCAFHSVCGSNSTPSRDDDDEGESHELDEINSPKSDSGPSISSPSYFDCNLCLRMAREPAMNSCGHLFCAICFQNWLQIFSLAHPECPICKSDVSPSLLHHSDSAACLYLLRDTSRPRRPQFWLQCTTTKSKEWTLFMKFQLT
ncbi:peroxisome biogenesis factor 10-like [Prunus avium]|uniref:E3 ubiquitin-protein ligase RMA n=1 Tax=Prunus avium TaxID=42229 RepID=A0A6P5TMQ9_PRUAV|nr:peroxisome biogenesis factor 10-like [Prunus avium]